MRHLALALALAIGLVGAPAVAAPAPRAPAAVTVRISNFTFSQPKLSVAPGTTVTWINDDDIPHNVVAADNRMFRSHVLDTGDSFSFTFPATGVFGYYCSLHPHMTGQIVVKAP
jgi:plastocyanin